MVYLDVREGVSADMLLSALLGLLEDEQRAESVKKLEKAAASLGVEFRLVEIADSGDKGYGLSYVGVGPASHGRNLDEALELLSSIQNDLGSRSQTTTEILMAIFNAEAEAHGERPETVHLHEIGRAEGILNIAGIGMVADLLRRNGRETFRCSSITIGKGTVVIGHGAIRIPAPASKILLRGLIYDEGIMPGERATPTGIAALKVLCKLQREEHPDKYARRSVGFGTKRFGGRLGRVVAYSFSSLID